MADIEKHIASFLGENPLAHYFVACSGGVDSMVLVHVLHKLGKRVSVLHVNYMLRGEDSELDQSIVETVCNEKGIKAHVKRIDFNRYLKETGGNLQEEARKARYRYFETFKLKSEFKIVLAQHADDQIETFFLNISRNAGMMGLSCMLDEHNNYVRPLLPFTKEEIRAYAIDQKVKWREDLSNSSNKYSRNKLRNVFIPELIETIPTLKESVLTLVAAFQETQKDLESNVQAIVQTISHQQKLSFETFDALNEFERIELLRQLDIPASSMSEFAKLRIAEKGKHLLISHQLYRSIIREEDYFYFQKREGMLVLPVLNIEEVTELPDQFSKEEIYINPDKIKGTLNVRVWKEGDRMKPVGMKGSKLISAILSDAKIPHHARYLQLVVHDEEKILWCVGVAVGREATSDLKMADRRLKVALKYF
jgi:tRNA(Ile)-lysidine synthase